MKTSTLITVGAVAALSSVAKARTEIKDAPLELKQGLAPSEYERELPPRPRLDPQSRARTEIRVFQTSRGEILQVEAVQQSIGDILRAITLAMGARAIIDPRLDELHLSMVSFRASNWEQLLDEVGVTEWWKSSSGTYFFAALPGVTKLRTRDEEEQEARQKPTKFGQLGTDGRLVPNLALIPNQPKKPQPDWEKHEFNGRAVYFIPLPDSAQPQEQKP